MHNLTIIISRTDTWLGSLIRRILGGNLNHCSFAIDGNFSSLYSYSRLHKRLWFTGCFCTESLDRYVTYEVFKIDISDENYERLCYFLDDLGRSYRIYNYIGALVMPFGIARPSKYHYLCSTFVAKVLEEYLGVELEKCHSLYKPMDVYKLLKKREESCLCV